MAEDKRIINVTNVDQLTQGPNYRIKVNEELLVLEGRANMLKNVIQDPDSTKEEISDAQKQLSSGMKNAKQNPPPGIPINEWVSKVSEVYANAGVREKKYGGGSVSRPARNF